MQLHAHRRTHAPLERRFFCPIAGCPKSFLRRYSLRMHLRGHGLNLDAARAQAAAAEPKCALDDAVLPESEPVSLAAAAVAAAAAESASAAPAAAPVAAALSGAHAQHRHGINCGHVIVRHGDHVDVVDRGMLWVRPPPCPCRHAARRCPHIIQPLLLCPPPGAGPGHRRRHAPARPATRLRGPQAPAPRPMPCARDSAAHWRPAGQAACPCLAAVAPGAGGRCAVARGLFQPLDAPAQPGRAPRPELLGAGGSRRHRCGGGRGARRGSVLLLAWERVGGPDLAAGTLWRCVSPSCPPVPGHTALTPTRGRTAQRPWTCWRESPWSP